MRSRMPGNPTPRIVADGNVEADAVIVHRQVDRIVDRELDTHLARVGVPIDVRSALPGTPERGERRCRHRCVRRRERCRRRTLSPARRPKPLGRFLEGLRQPLAAQMRRVQQVRRHLDLALRFGRGVGPRRRSLQRTRSCRPLFCGAQRGPCARCSARAPRRSVWPVELCSSWAIRRRSSICKGQHVRRQVARFLLDLVVLADVLRNTEDELDPLAFADRGWQDDFAMHVAAIFTACGRPPAGDS